MPVELQEGKYYTAIEAAEEIGISERQMRRFVEEGAIRTVNVNGRFMVHENDLEEFKSTYKKWSKGK